MTSAMERIQEKFQGLKRESAKIRYAAALTTAVVVVGIELPRFSKREEK